MFLWWGLKLHCYLWKVCFINVREGMSKLWRQVAAKHTTQNLVNLCMKKFLKKLFVQRNLSFTLPKRELISVLPYLGKASLDLRTNLRRTIERNWPFGKLKTIFTSKCKLNTLFHFKIYLKKKSALEKFIAIGVVTATLLTTEKPFVTFIPENLNTWGSLILQENA